MAPESIRDKTSTHASDVWSFGILCWEVFSYGATPYPGKLAIETVAFVAAGGRMARPRGCPRAVYSVVQDTWEADPDNRPTFDETVSLLKEALANLDDGGDDDDDVDGEQQGAAVSPATARSRSDTVASGKGKKRYKDLDEIRREEVLYLGDNRNTLAKAPTRPSMDGGVNVTTDGKDGKDSSKEGGSDGGGSTGGSGGSGPSKRSLRLKGAELWASTDTDAGDSPELGSGSGRAVNNELYVGRDALPSNSSDSHYLPLGRTERLPPVMERGEDGTFRLQGSGGSGGSSNGVAETVFDGGESGSRGSTHAGERPYEQPVSQQQRTAHGGTGASEAAAPEHSYVDTLTAEEVAATFGQGKGARDSGDAKPQSREEREYLDPVVASDAHSNTAGVRNGNGRDSGSGGGSGVHDVPQPPERRSKGQSAQGQRRKDGAGHKEERPYLEPTVASDVSKQVHGKHNGRDEKALPSVPPRGAKGAKAREREYLEPSAGMSQLLSGEREKGTGRGDTNPYLDLMAPDVVEMSSQVFSKTDMDRARRASRDARVHGKDMPASPSIDEIDPPSRYPSDEADVQMGQSRDSSQTLLEKQQQRQRQRQRQQQRRRNERSSSMAQV